MNVGLYKDVLDWCNKIRASRGLSALTELPKGERCGEKCPVARALEASYVSPAHAVFRKPTGEFHRRIPLPRYVRDFVHAFDIGFYPELIQERS